MIFTAGVGTGGEQLATLQAEQTDCSAEVFTPEWEAATSGALEGLQFTAAAHDTRTGCWYYLNPDLSLTTASAIKLQILSANLDRAERLERSLTEAERTAAERMLWYSHNSPPTSTLYGQVGTAGMSAFSSAVEATTIQHSQIYGITRARASDLTRSSLATLNLEVDSPLTVQSREVAREILAGVHPSQRWGVSAGLPEDHTVWLKNGFFPCTSCAPFAGVYTWRVSSTGYVERPDETGWAITVLTDGAQTQQQGVDAVEEIAKVIAEELAEGPPSRRDVDASNCTTVGVESTPTSITAALGVDRSEWDDVRWVSGNEGPLRGQLMCTRESHDFSGQSACICPRDRRVTAQG